MKYLPLVVTGILTYLLLFTACQQEPDFIPVPTTDTTVFAVLGDYGEQGNPAKKVAAMVNSWQPEFIITTGDNNYDSGRMEDIPNNIIQYYEDYIYNPDAPTGYVCQGQANLNQVNCFFSAPGNHDYYADNLSSYLRFFTLPADERNYDFVKGAVHFFSIDSNREEELPQTQLWLQTKIAASTAPFKIVYFHHPPYSSSQHGNTASMQWAFAEWGVDAVISGHEHAYLHIIQRETPDTHYFVNGLGGRKSFYGCNDQPLDENEFGSFCYNREYGAMRVTATDNRLTLAFYSVKSGGRLIDEVVIEK